MTPFQQALSEAFLGVMRARRPDCVWSAAEPRKGGQCLTDPNDASALTDRPTRAAA